MVSMSDRRRWARYGKNQAKAMALMKLYTLESCISLDIGVGGGRHGSIWGGPGPRPPYSMATIIPYISLAETIPLVETSRLPNLACNQSVSVSKTRQA